MNYTGKWQLLIKEYNLSRYEYPIEGKPPMMTHIFKNETGETIIAAKGAPEAILHQSALFIEELKHIEEQAQLYA